MPLLFSSSLNFYFNDIKDIVAAIAILSLSMLLHFVDNNSQIVVVLGEQQMDPGILIKDREDEKKKY